MVSSQHTHCKRQVNCGYTVCIYITTYYIHRLYGPCAYSRSCILGRLHWRLLYLYRRTSRICTRGFYGQHLSRVIFLEWVSTAHCCCLYARGTTVALEITTLHSLVMPAGCTEQIYSSFWNHYFSITTCQFISHKFLLTDNKYRCLFLHII